MEQAIDELVNKILDDSRGSVADEPHGPRQCVCGGTGQATVYRNEDVATFASGSQPKYFARAAVACSCERGESIATTVVGSGKDKTIKVGTRYSPDQFCVYDEMGRHQETIEAWLLDRKPANYSQELADF